MDAAYLQANVGDVLAEGLARVAIEKPRDPVEFVGQFLLKHVANELRAQQVRAAVGRGQAAGARAGAHLPRTWPQIV